MVDNDRGRQRREEVPELGQVHGLEIDHDMPAEFGDPAGDLDQFVFRREIDKAFDEIEADAAHACGVH